uniref:Peptidase C1A papain C-terminal domain-containing protein n=1 Tax=Globisporangium ultimum (strain ATCC 200006 / CBS 805.95 / DAOM BR144) TaxID=431595 RepID=K3W741_GLOUD
MGVHERHLSDSSKRSKLPEMFVHQEMRAAKAAATRRRLMMAATMSSSSSSTSTGEFNWCNTENPKGRSVCSAVKSQQNCGSCWAFAAADAIETAVAIAANQTTAVALSPQQFLSCSTRETEQTFEYCWATSGVSGVTWLSDSIKWKSTNNGCDGGMTHGAFMDAAQLQYGLVTELEMPYSDSSGSSGSNQTCVTTSNKTAASITDWTQIVGKDCSVSSDPNVLLRNALQDQPIAVALNSDDPFKDYSGGFYSCPNDGDLSSKDDINHALLLVGYGTDATSGDYWILKNSYGSSWGDKGYMKLLADNKANCGLNVFPVIPLGATAGVATATVDGGGAKKFVGLSPSTWIALAVVLSVVTIVLTAIGVWFSSKKRAALREQNGGAIYLAQTPQHTNGATI